MSALTQTGQPAAPAAGRRRERSGARLIDLAWLTWRQHRTAIIVGLVAAVAVTASMVYLAARITTINTECGNAPCPSGAAQAVPLRGGFGLISLSNDLGLVMMFVPLLAGVFLGPPCWPASTSSAPCCSPGARTSRRSGGCGPSSPSSAR